MILRSRSLLASIFLSCLSVVAIAACGSDDTGTSSSSSSSSSGANPNGLSTAFTSNCARCHGPKGAGQDSYPRLPGDKTTDASFIALVRAGKGDMPAFISSQISDDALKSDFAWLVANPTR